MRLYPFFIPHRGCANLCVFCNQRRVSGFYGELEPAGVAQALESMLPAAGDGEVAFYGGSFSLLPGEVQEALLGAVTPFVRAGRVGGVRVSTRPDGLGPGQVAFLAEHGVRTVEIGCQSFDEEVLARSGRGHGAADAAGAVCRLREAGLAVGLQLMPGLPGADAAEALESLEKALAIAPDFLRIYPTVVFEGTALAELWRRGAYQPLELEAAVELCASMLVRCDRSGVAVIRVGLQGDADLDRGQGRLAGPYHPAFGQLVRSRLWLRALRQLLLRGEREVFVHPDDFSDALGHRRSNLISLQGLCPEYSLRGDGRIPRRSLLARGRVQFLSTLVENQESTSIDAQ